MKARVIAGDYPVMAVLLLFVFALLMIAGSDGWLRVDPLRSDSDWFFISGRSWMEGLEPYRDFTDSKGPLLWLIYGLGYIISPDNFHGLFFFELIALWGAFYFIYKSCNIVLEDRPRALLASMGVALFIFFPAMHNQMRIEDFCQLFQAIVLYVLVKTLYQGKYSPICGVALGLCCGCTLMMKYAYTLTLAVPTLVLLIYLLRRSRQEAVRFIPFFLGGMAAIVLPFVIYFLCVGTLQDFMGEYFLNTGATILNVKEYFDTQENLRYSQWPFRIYYLFRRYNYWSVFLWLTVISFSFTLYWFRRGRWLDTALILWFVCSVLLFSMVDGEGYYLTLSVFTIGVFISIVRIFPGMSLAASMMGGACVLAVVALISTTYRKSEFFYSGRNQKVVEVRSEVASLINAYGKNKGSNPTVLFLKTSPQGETVGTKAVAATKYWAQQAGMTPEMTFHHENDFLHNKPDFVFIPESEVGLRKILETNGYRLLYSFIPVPSVRGEEAYMKILYVYDGTENGV